jgi:hypothetical protein
VELATAAELHSGRFLREYIPNLQNRDRIRDDAASMAIFTRVVTPYGDPVGSIERNANKVKFWFTVEYCCLFAVTDIWTEEAKSSACDETPDWPQFKGDTGTKHRIWVVLINTVGVMILIPLR